MIDRTLSVPAFDRFGLGALGATSGRIASHWAESAPSFDATTGALTLAAGSRWHAPVHGTLQWRAFGAPELRDLTGAALTGVVAVLTFDPAAALRIRRLIGRRLDGRTDGRSVRPTPFALAIRGGDAPPEVGDLSPGDPPLAPFAAPAGDPLTHGELTFHDADGACLDGVAVACLLRDLLRGFPALLDPDGGPVQDVESTGSSGGVGAIAALATGRRLALVDLFGRPWPDTGAVGVQLGASGGRLGGGVHDWADGASLQATDTDAGLLRFGLHPEGTLGVAAIAPPALPTQPFPTGSPAPDLPRQHLRVAVVDLGLHLRGNWAAGETDGVPAPDADTRTAPQPPVFDGDAVEVLFDGLATMGAAREVAGAGFSLAASPTIGGDTRFPGSRTERWPAAPTPVGAAGDLDGATSAAARAGGVAAYVGATADVVLRFPAGSLPAEAHVRVFPRVDGGRGTVPLDLRDFSRRGDGGTAVVGADGAAAVLIRDPFGAGAGTRPSTPTLRYDLLVISRGPAGPKRALFGGLDRAVGTGETAPPEPAGAAALAAIPDDRRGIGPAPILGLPPTAPATGSDAVLAALALGAPREAPRYRTMSRNDTVVAGHDGTRFTAVITPGWLDARSVTGDARLGNPGRAAGPEEHAPGLRATGRLATALARAALRRTHHLSTRLVELDDARWAEPAAGTGTVASAVLTTIADTVDSPELRLVPQSVVHALPADWDGLIDELDDHLPPGLTNLPSLVPAPGAGDRWVDEVRREASSAHHGRRDAQWSVRWALAHAQRLVYVESALFGASAASDAPASGFDWVEALVARLGEAPDLRVILVTPKRVPFGRGYESFAQRFHVRRNEAVAALKAAAPDRVVALHPVGFPGRPETVRGTLAVVDDVWAMVGSSTWSRRGWTFDGGLDVAWLDRQLSEGASVGVRDLRRRAMARVFGLAPPAAGETASAGWVRLAEPRAAFGWAQELVARGGDGLCEPLWPGLPETELPALDASIADPDGRSFDAVLALFADLLADLGPNGV